MESWRPRVNMSYKFTESTVQESAITASEVCNKTAENARVFLRNFNFIHLRYDRMGHFCEIFSLVKDKVVHITVCAFYAYTVMLILYLIF